MSQNIFDNDLALIKKKLFQGLTNQPSLECAY